MEQTNATFSMNLNASEFSWQLTYFQTLHDALVEAFNELIPTVEDNEDIEWKDDTAIIEHAMETGLLEKTLELAKQKFVERLDD